jgi:hypothetical protein
VSPVGWGQWTAVALGWMIGAFGGGAALAWLYKRLYPGLAFYKLWALWSMFLSAAVAVLLAFGVARF